MICPLCKNNKGAIVYNKIPNLTRCSGCGFVYILGQYSKELYSQDYFIKEGMLRVEIISAYGPGSMMRLDFHRR